MTQMSDSVPIILSNISRKKFGSPELGAYVLAKVISFSLMVTCEMINLPVPLRNELLI